MLQSEDNIVIFKENLDVAFVKIGIGEVTMSKITFEAPEMEIICLDSEDIITTSACLADGITYSNCGIDGSAADNMSSGTTGSIFNFGGK